MTTYEDIEQSVAEGEPIELYDIWDVEGTHYRWNTSSIIISYGSYDYEPNVIDRSELVLGGNNEVSAIDIKLKRGNIFASRFIAAPVEGEVQFVLYRQQAGFTVKFCQGFLSAVSFDKNGVPTSRFEPRSSDMVGVGQRRRNQRLCDYCLYKMGCWVNEELYRVDGTLTNVSGLVLTSAIFATKTDGWFVGGEIVIGVARRLIKAHVTNTITISRTMSVALIGVTFRAYAGCDHTPGTCKTKFDNKLNFGGNEYLPTKNSFLTGVNVTGYLASASSGLIR